MCEEALFALEARRGTTAQLIFRDGGAMVIMRLARRDPSDGDLVFVPVPCYGHRHYWWRCGKVPDPDAGLKTVGEVGLEGLETADGMPRVQLGYSAWREPFSRFIHFHYDPAISRVHFLPHGPASACAFPGLGAGPSAGQLTAGDEDALIRYEVEPDADAGPNAVRLRVRDARVSLAWLLRGMGTQRRSGAAWLAGARPARRARHTALRRRVAELAGWWHGALRSGGLGAAGWLWDPSDPRVLGLMAQDYEDGNEGEVRLARDLEELAQELAAELRAGAETPRMRLARRMQRMGGDLMHPDTVWSHEEAVDFLAGSPRCLPMQACADAVASTALANTVWAKTKKKVKEAAECALLVVIAPMYWCSVWTCGDSDDFY